MVDLFFYRPPEEISAEKKAHEESQAQAQAHSHQGSAAPFEQSSNPPFKGGQISEGTDWSAVQVTGGHGVNAWDSAQGESWAGGNRPNSWETPVVTTNFINM